MENPTVKREKPVPTITLDDSDDDCKEVHVCEHCSSFRSVNYKDILDHISRKHPKKRRTADNIKQEPGTTSIKTENIKTEGGCAPSTSLGAKSLYDGNPHGEQTIRSINQIKKEERNPQLL